MKLSQFIENLKDMGKEKDRGRMWWCPTCEGFSTEGEGSVKDCQNDQQGLHMRIEIVNDLAEKDGA